MNTQEVETTRTVHEESQPEDYVSGIKVEKSIIVNRPLPEVYNFWRDFENLPRFMSHIKSVVVTDPKHSHWTMHTPGRTTIEWDAEILEENENQYISWRSLEGSEVMNAGSVRFTEAPNGQGTEVHLSMQYDPPGGWLGRFAAWLFGEDPDHAIEADLQEFKVLMESINYQDTKEMPVSA